MTIQLSPPVSCLLSIQLLCACRQ